MSSFFHILIFSLLGWPAVCFATLATADKIAADKYDPTVRIALANVATWSLGALMLIFSVHSRLVSGKGMNQFYIGATLAHSVFFIHGLPDWDRIGLAYFVYACVVYASLSDSSLLIPYFTIFAFFRSIQSVVPAARTLSSKFLDVEPRLDMFLLIARYSEIFILGSVCALSVWTQGYMDPVIFGLNFVTVYGTRFRSFIQKKSHSV